MGDKRSADPFPLMLTGDLGVEEKGMITSVPCHVDKADQAAVRLASSHPAKAVGPDLIPPACRSSAAMCCDECHHLYVSDRPTPAILNRLGHMPDRPVTRWRGQQRLRRRPATFCHPTNHASHLIRYPVSPETTAPAIVPQLTPSAKLSPPSQELARPPPRSRSSQ